MPDQLKCGECGRAIPPDASQACCPVCLLCLGLNAGQENVKEQGSEDESNNSAGGEARSVSSLAATPEPPVPDCSHDFGGYEPLEEIARGGMGVVYRARHRRLEKVVALKVTQPGASPERFLREARLLARVASPYVVPVHDFDVLESGRLMLVMEWVEGHNLAKILQKHEGPLDEDQVLPWMRQVAEGMLAVAEAGITHRDLKPSNILIDRQSKARVVDFGLARGPIALGDLTLSSQLMGTPHYMAPEQAESPRHVDTRADIYSFGATFYHMLTDRVPFAGESAFAILFKHKMEPLTAPQALNHKLSDRTSALLQRCLAKSPAQRFPSFSDLLGHLQPVPPHAPVVEDQKNLGLARDLAEFRSWRDACLARQLHPQFENLGTQMMNSPKAYTFDSELLHALLEHHKRGSLWARFVIRRILSWTGERNACFRGPPSRAKGDSMLLTKDQRCSFEVESQDAKIWGRWGLRYQTSNWK